MPKYYTIPKFNYYVQRKTKDWKERKGLHESLIEALELELTGLEFEYPNSNDILIKRGGIVDNIFRSKAGDLLVTLRLVYEQAKPEMASHSDKNIKAFRVDRIESEILVTII